MAFLRTFSLLGVAFIAGCGNGSAPTTTANQDELQKWAAENPVTDEADASLIEGAVK